jgi:membrane fusion protein (multidrug efflux system)
VLDSFPTRTFHGKVIRISPVADIETRVLPVMVEVQNPGNEIKAGLTGFVRIKMAKQGLSLPAAAVIRKGSKAMTFKVEQDRARIREIRVGQLAKNGMVEILNGLQPGDEVVLFGNLPLQDNDRIDTNWRKWANRE